MNAEPTSAMPRAGRSIRPAGHAARARHRLDRAALRRDAGRARARRPRRDRGADLEATRAQAEQCGISSPPRRDPELDLTVDGADEIAPDLDLIKGGAARCCAEKIVAAASARMVVIADSSKWVAVLGAFRLPIEVVPFGLGATERAVAAAIAATGMPGR
jgi:hypothetical protein